MKSSDQLVRDLIKDEYFHKWIIDPDQECIDFWIRWGNEEEERKECIERAKKILLSFKFKSGSISQAKKDMLWENITHRIENTSFIHKRQRINNPRHLWYGIAAAVALLMIVVFAYKNTLVKHSENTISKVSFIEKVAPRGKISSFEFEDGTIVKLFSGSVIRYPEKFSEQVREVYLEGEGFFDVTKDANRPFIVKTKSFSTTVLGTSFNIRTYSNSSKCDVSLVTGKVKVERFDNLGEVMNEVILIPGEEAIFKNESVIKQPFDLEEIVSWKDGYIYLENKSFDETLQILERWFEVDFEVKNRNKAVGKKGTGKFKNQSLENILQVIGHSFEFSFEIHGHKVIINL